MGKSIGVTMRLRSDDLTWQVIDGEIVVLDLRSSQYFVVNGSGARLWQRLASEASTDDLADELESTYEVPAAIAHQHATGFVADLRGRGLLES